jgi:methylated-DNA-[protein]-cysteine S-methyltransferase
MTQRPAGKTERPPGVSQPLVLTSADTPWGPARIAVGERGVVALSLLTSVDAFEAGLARRGFRSLVPLERAAGLAEGLAVEVRERVATYAHGAPVPLEDLPVDLRDRSDWDRLVLNAVRAIPRGETVGYGGLARRIGRPGAARAVGGAVGRNPVGLLVPCHRVIAGDGSLGGYGVAAWGGVEAALDLKRRLLALEGVHIA